MSLYLAGITASFSEEHICGLGLGLGLNYTLKWIHFTQWLLQEGRKYASWSWRFVLWVQLDFNVDVCEVSHTDASWQASFHQREDDIMHHEDAAAQTPASGFSSQPDINNVRWNDML